MTSSPIFLLRGAPPATTTRNCFADGPPVGAVTPVPGGVGPMTIACLFANTGRAGKAMIGNHMV